MQIEVRWLSPHDASMPIFQDAWLHPVAVTQGPVHKSSKETQSETCHLQCEATHGTLDIPGILLVNRNEFFAHHHKLLNGCLG